MSRQRASIEGLADDVVRADVAAQQALPAWTKDSAIPSGVPFLRDTGTTGRNWTYIGLASLAAVALVGVGVGYALFSGQPPRSTAASQPPVTQPPVTQPPVTQPPVTQPPVTQPPVTQPPAVFDLAAATEAIDVISGGLISVPSDLVITTDPAGDQFTFASGFPAPVQPQPWADLAGLAGFATDIDAAQAQMLSDHFACGPPLMDDPFIVLCNQDQPLQAGQYAVLLTSWNSPPPDPFGETAICSWAVQSNLDGDRATGFPDPITGHPLTGSEVYFESLLFVREGRLAGHSLLTDYRAPVRADTNRHQGNVPTVGRGILAPPVNHDAFDVLFLLPADQIDHAVGSHAYCATDRADLLRTVAVDALGHPTQRDYPFFPPLTGAT